MTDVAVATAALLLFLVVSHYALHRRAGRIEGLLGRIEARGLRTLTEVRDANDKTAVVADAVTQTAALVQAVIPPVPAWTPEQPDRRHPTPEAFPRPPLPPPGG